MASASREQESAARRAAMFASLGAQDWGSNTVDSELARIFSGLSIEQSPLKTDLLTRSPSPSPLSTPCYSGPSSANKENTIFQLGLGKFLQKRRQKKPKQVFNPSLETVCEKQTETVCEEQTEAVCEEQTEE
jgi:hypothetical protein